MKNLIQSKRFVVRQSLIGKEATIKVEFKSGKTVTYDHDKAFELMRGSLEASGCWVKYKTYTSSSNIPKVIRDTDAVLEISEATVAE